MARKIRSTKTEYDVTLERREGKLVAVIEAESTESYEESSHEH